MKEIELRNVKGTTDYSPREQYIRNYISDTLKCVFEKYGFKPLQTPLLCYYDLFALKYDEENDILAFSGDIPHNTVTPIARRKGDAFELDIVLRNNRTSAEHPDGIFHPHKELHHIKKENIGLIEVMGLAVLPGRLEKELDIIANILCGELDYNREEAERNNEINKHIPWIEKMLRENSSLNYIEAKELLKKEVGFIFSKVLEDAGVFKRNKKGQAGLDKFLNQVL